MSVKETGVAGDDSSKGIVLHSAGFSWYFPESSERQLPRFIDSIVNQVLEAAAAAAFRWAYLSPCMNPHRPILYAIIVYMPAGHLYIPLFNELFASFPVSLPPNLTF